jgi:DNA-binding Lrp family transcriptional regulator
MHEIDQRDRDLLNAIQNEVPLSSTPFAILGQQIDMSEKEVLKRIERLKRESVVRQISAIFDSRGLGYRSSVVAARVDPDKLERSASVVNMHPGVTQNYRRNHDFNLWFTIAVPPNSRLGLEKTVERLGEEAECERVRLLPALKHFKGADSESGETHDEGFGAEQKEPLSEREIEFVRVLQRDLPLTPRPFEVLARQYNLSGDDLLSAAQTFQRRQQLRRYCAWGGQPRKSSFSASAMGVWSVAERQADEVGSKMASHHAVSQCFLRPTYEDWPYNLFTIVHGRSVDECESVLNELADQTGIRERQALFPMKEFKKSRISFFAPDIDTWESVRLSGAQQSAAS